MAQESTQTREFRELIRSPSTDSDATPKEKLKCKIALTFDDGPHPTLTPILMKALTERNVPATFFMLAENAEKSPSIVQEMLKPQNTLFRVASHGIKHDRWDKLSVERVRQELTRLRDVPGYVEQNETLGYETLRPPYGAKNLTVERLCREMGISCLAMWGHDSEDWKAPNREKGVLESKEPLELLNACRAGQREIVPLYHDIHKSTVDAIPGIIDELRANQEFDVEFVHLSEIDPKVKNQYRTKTLIWTDDEAHERARKGYDSTGKWSPHK